MRRCQCFAGHKTRNYRSRIVPHHASTIFSKCMSLHVIISKLCVCLIIHCTSSCELSSLHFALCFFFIAFKSFHPRQMQSLLLWAGLIQIHPCSLKYLLGVLCPTLTNSPLACPLSQEEPCHRHQAWAIQEGQLQASPCQATHKPHHLIRPCQATHEPHHLIHPCQATHKPRQPIRPCLVTHKVHHWIRPYLTTQMCLEPIHPCPYMEEEHPWFLVWM